jgi:hypothetical protein
MNASSQIELVDSIIAVTMTTKGTRLHAWNMSTDMTLCSMKWYRGMKYAKNKDVIGNADGYQPVGRCEACFASLSLT